METPEGLFQAGKLTDAVQLAKEAVKSHPSDVAARSILCELLCFAGDLERADKQLDTITTLNPDAMQGVSLLRHLIRSEYSRREVFEEGRIPAFLEEPTAAQQNRLQALLCLREGNAAEAQRLIREAESQEVDVKGTLNGEPFSGFRDLDDVLGPIIEVYTATGKYYWFDRSQIVTLEFNPIQHLSDMLWRAGRIQTTGEITGRVHVPAVYHRSASSEDERIRMGRATDWIPQGDSEIVCGAGCREFLAGDDAVTLLQIKEVTFESSAAE